ncbi:MAG: 5-(carboxyamino)imidazole ribonucleotide synthase [Spirochaetes bacterium]|jgi:5-(carboxyamino)imidazole ribonucleotide synthase|nr:5-(carboxyamino)imidazole ribonucleotide synthase [Spirochaetota bacterium]
MSGTWTSQHVLILGGGQLGRMLGEAAARLDVRVTVIDPAPGCPAATTTDRHVLASFRDTEAILAATERDLPDLATVEIENVSTEALRELRTRGVPVHPSPELLETIKDKLSQRDTLAAAGLPGPRYVEVASAPGDEAGNGALDLNAAARAVGLPAVQKLRFGGYDGRGVARVAAVAGKPAELPLSGASILEEQLELSTELAVLVARSSTGETRSYAPVEMQMDRELNLVRVVVYPAAVPADTTQEARRIAQAAVEALDGVGLFAVELFVTSAGKVLINEIAPRPHNSGHLTIEAAETSQFEQHLRAVLGLPLGSVEMRGAAAMVNLIGTGPEGSTRYTGLPEVLALPGVHLHLYGKRNCRPGRKMGHLTAIGQDRQESVERALSASAGLRVHGKEEDS